MGTGHPGQAMAAVARLAGVDPKVGHARAPTLPRYMAGILAAAPELPLNPATRITVQVRNHFSASVLTMLGPLLIRFIKVFYLQRKPCDNNINKSHFRHQKISYEDRIFNNNFHNTSCLQNITAG